ncbi:MAG: hypothetical protein GWN85_20710 [Gemmatimonadetes bacterium]|nr:hypothetical protein [Gemmatimonadota bacterium]
MHAPLTALLLLDAAVQHGAEPHEYVYRATAPLFGGEPISLTGRDEDGVLRLEARNADGVLSMKGAVT